jgi:hypothetical protein
VFSKALMLLSLLILVMPVQAAMDDPTRPPSLGAAKSAPSAGKHKRPRWLLSSTLIAAERRSAVIDGRVVVRGDRINGATVVTIEPGSVRLRARGKEFTLLMLEKNIKSLSRVQTSAVKVPAVKTLGAKTQ